MWYKNIAGRFFGLVTKHACDRWTGAQNYDSQDRVSIAASRGINFTVMRSYYFSLEIRSVEPVICPIAESPSCSSTPISM